jgi:hypothetical protein
VVLGVVFVVVVLSWSVTQRLGVALDDDNDIVVLSVVAMAVVVTVPRKL